MLLEVLADNILGSIETKVGTEDGGAWLTRRVAVLVLALLAAVLSCTLVLARSAEVDTKFTVVEQSAVLLLESLSGVCWVDKLDVSEALAPVAVTVGDDANASELSIALELTSEPLLVNVPAKIADKEVGNALALRFGLGLLLGRLCVLLSLALLADWLLFLFLVAAVARVVG